MTDDNLVGQTLAGKYRIEEVLGKGGMGVVLGARHIKLDERVAIKVLRPAMMEVPGMVTRFLREARAASKIKSAHVVRVTDVDTLEDGAPYMVMEHLDGADFSDLRKERGTLGVAEAVGFVLQACDAIGEAHSLGIVHRDLKPSNLFLHRQKDGRTVVKVLDFGISKVETPGEQDTTNTGQMMGSPKYMSPEQMLSMRDVDARSDIWSLGAILYELLTGRAPFVADTAPRVCALVLHADPAPPTTHRPELPADLSRAVMRCLEKEPRRRFARVAELIAAIEPFAPPPDPLTRSAGTHPAPLLMVSTASALPSVTPTPAVMDAETRREPAPGKGKRGAGRVAAVALGVAVVAGLGVLYATQRGPAAVAAVAPPDSPPSAAPRSAPVETAAPAVKDAPPATSTAEPARTTYSISDLPDVRPAAPPRPAGSSFARPRASAADPFGGRRN